MLPPLFRFSHQFTSKIWKVAIDASKGVLILELRDTEEQLIEYAEVNLTDGAFTTFSIKASDLWTAILACHYPKLLLEQFLDPQNPNSKRLLVYDLLEKRVEKTIDSFQFEAVENGQVKGLDLANDGTPQSFYLGIDHKKTSDQILSPIYYSAKSDSGEMISTFLELENSGVGYEYLEKDDYIIICYYQRLGTNFDRHLLVIKDEREFLNIKLDEEMTGYASGAFFIFKELLIFIEQRNQLHAIEL